MSSIRKGVLRTVRLLPDVIKIGVEPETLPPPETALPSLEEGEQILHESPFGNAHSHKGEKGQKEEHSVLIKDLRDKLEQLEGSLSSLQSEKASLTQNFNSLNEELYKTKAAYEEKERERAASNEALRESIKTEARTQGHAEGLQTGYAEGLEKARSEVELDYKNRFSAIAATLENVSASLEADFADLATLNQPRMLRLWLDMLKRMLHRETLLVPDSVIPVLGDVLARLSDKNSILIYLAPEDLEFLQDRVQTEFQEILRGVKHLELKADPNVDKGSCLVETNLGVYDARWRTQLAQIEVSMESLFQKLAPPVKTKATRGRKKKTAETIPPPEDDVQS